MFIPYLTFTFWSAAFMQICAVANYSKPCHKKTSRQGSRVCHGLTSSRDQLSHGRRRDRRERNRRERNRRQGWEERNRVQG